MFARQLFTGSLVLASIGATRPLSAQRVIADIRIGGGPVAGHVIIGDRGDYRPRPRGYEYERARVIRVERVSFRDRGRRNGWFKDFRRHARIVVVYYDRRDDRYYDRYYGRGGLREIEVYERDGRFYRPDDDDRYDNNDRYGRDDRSGRDRDRDRDRNRGRDRDWRQDQ